MVGNDFFGGEEKVGKGNKADKVAVKRRVNTKDRARR